MTIAELAVTIGLLGVLGLVASRVGLSAIPAYLLAGILLGPNEPTEIVLVRPSEVTDFVAEIGLVFLLFFLGLEFTLARIGRSRRHLALGGGLDLLLNASLGLAVGVLAFGTDLAAVVLAAGVYVSSSAIAVKGLTDFRRLADEETDVVLGVLVVEDLVVALVLGLAATGGASAGASLEVGLKAAAFVLVSLAASRWLARPIERALFRLEPEFFLLAVFGFVVGMAAVAHELGVSEAIGALMAGIVLSETSVRREIEERFFAFRDVFAALFFFAFGLTIDLGAAGDVGWIVLVALVAAVVGKLSAGLGAAALGGLSRRQGLNAGAALVAHGEFTIVLAQLAATNAAIPAADRERLAAVSGLFVLTSAVVGLLLMRSSKRLGRALFPTPRLERPNDRRAA